MTRTSASIARRPIASPRGHPWIFSSDITDRGGAQPGEAVEVADPQRPHTRDGALQLHVADLPCACSRGQVGTGRPRFFLRAPAAQPTRIAARVVSDSDAYRVVHAEADLLPGSDRRSLRRLSRQCRPSTRAWIAPRTSIVACLEELLQPERNRGAQRCAGAHEGRAAARESRCCPAKCPSASPSRMNGLTLARRPAPRPEDRHLPRSARKLPRRRAIRPRRPSARLLHLHRRIRAAPGAAVRVVEAVDSSAAALAIGASERRRQRNRQRRVPGSGRLRPAGRLRSARREFSMVVLDPPAFAKSRTDAGSGRARVQGNQSARAAPARARRHPGHLLLLASHERGNAARDRRRGGARCRPNPARAGAADPSRRIIRSC